MNFQQQRKEFHCRVDEYTTIQYFILNFVGSANILIPLLLFTQNCLIKNAISKLKLEDFV